jgi:GTP-binding protein
MLEIIFVGRSNVGKSSVINALCEQKNLARTSKTPGRTRSVNVYSISMGKWLIDLPGYGFARVSPQEKASWQEMVSNCILSRSSKKTVCVIIDAYVGPTERDEAMIAWLKENNMPFKIIANKCDKLPKLVSLDEVRDKLCSIFGLGSDDVFCVSAKKGMGVSAFRQYAKKFLKLN